MNRSASPWRSAGDKSKASVSLCFVPLSRSHLQELTLALSRCRHVTQISLHHCLWSMPSAGDDDDEDGHEDELTTFHPISLSDRLLQTLASFSWLERIDLRNNHLTKQHLNSYVKGLTTGVNYPSAARHQLQSLNFSYNSALGDAGLQLLSTRALPLLLALTELHVAGCGLTDEGLHALLTASITTNPNLRVLVADDNPGLQLVAPKFHNDNCVLSKIPLTILSLKDTGIGDEGLIVLANAMVTNTSLTVVKLQGTVNANPSDGRGLCRLLQVLQSDNLTLQNVGIDRTTGPHAILIDRLVRQCRVNQHVRTQVQRLVYPMQTGATRGAPNDTQTCPSAPRTDIPSLGWSRVFVDLSGHPKSLYQVLRVYPDVISHWISPDPLSKARESYRPSDGLERV